MAYQELVDYILSARQKGFEDSRIKEKLLSSGWLLGAVEEAFGVADKSARSSVKPIQPQVAQAVDTLTKPTDARPSSSQPVSFQPPFNKAKDEPWTPSLKKPEDFMPDAKTSPALVATPFPSRIATETHTSGKLVLPLKDNRSTLPGILREEKAPVKPDIAPVIPNSPGVVMQKVVPETSGKSHKLLWVLLAVALLVILGAGGAAAAGYYGYLKIPFISPSSKIVWERFNSGIAQKSSPIEQLKVDLSLEYKDKGIALKPEVAELFKLQDANFSDLVAKFTLGGYMEIKPEGDKQNLATDVQSGIGFESGGTKIELSLPMVIKDNMLYLNLDKSPWFAKALGLGADKSQGWVKMSLDPNVLDQAIGSTGNFVETDVEVKDALKKVDTAKMEQYLKDHPLYNPVKYITAETLHGQKTYKYSLETNKENVKGFAGFYADEVFAGLDGENVSGEMKEAVKGFMMDVFSRTDVGTVDVWVGQYDYLPYKVAVSGKVMSLVSLANSASDMVKMSLEGAGEGMKKIGDVSQINFALEMYKNEHGGYPQGKDGQAQGLISNYLPAWPIAPKATGACSDWDNTYWYESKGDPKDDSKGGLVYPGFEFTFCLEKPYGGFPAGIGDMTSEKGILVGGQEACVGENCKVDEAGAMQLFKNFYQGIQYTADFNLELNMYDYGKTEGIQVPEGAVDISDLEKNKVSEDTLLLGDQGQKLAEQLLVEVSQYTTAFEAFRKDKGEYPAALSELIPTYMGDQKVLQYPVLGACTQENSSLVYQKLAPTSFELKFCLPVEAGGYPAGGHTASEKGIQ